MHTLNLAQLGEKKGAAGAEQSMSTQSLHPTTCVPWPCGWLEEANRAYGGKECSPGRWAYVATGVTRFGQEREEGVTTCLWILAILRESVPE